MPSVAVVKALDAVSEKALSVSAVDANALAVGASAVRNKLIRVYDTFPDKSSSIMTHLAVL